MLKRQLLSCLLLGGAFLLVGCASSAPPPHSGPEGRESPLQEDTLQREGDGQSVAAPDTVDDAISALRAAYVDRSYAKVVREAQTLLRDSLSSSQAGRVYALLGRAQQAQGKDEAALEAFRKARVKMSEAGKPVVHVDRSLGESFAALYRWEQAELAFRRVLTEEPGDLATRQALAEVYVRSRDWKAAEKQYTRLVEEDSSNGRWWAHLGRCALERGRSDRAIQSYARAHRLLPQAAEVALPLSRLYREEGREGDAAAVIDTTISHQPGDPWLWRRRADLAFEQNDLNDARRAYRRTLALGDSSATIFRRIGLIEVKQERYAKAVDPLRQSYQRDSRHSRTMLYLGITYRHLDSLRQASHFLEQTIEQETRGPLTTAYAEYAETKDQQAEVRAAIRAYKTALRLQPERSEFHFQLAHLYDRHYREKATAVRYYRRFLRASDSTQKELRTYTENRLEALRPILHMQEESLHTVDSTRRE